ncbi:MAG: hypothetical protein WAV01_03790 [Candidatus Saccharimonadales bacterium]
MKKLSQILAIMAIVLAPFAMTGTAYAEVTCDVGYTGPDLNNLCTSVTTYVCEVDNETDIAVVIDNDQTAISGDISLEDNTTGGSAGTGSASNDNNVTFNVTVSNEGVCEAIAVVPANVTPDEEEEEENVTPVTPVAPIENKPTVLPNTSADYTSGYIVVAAALLGVGAVISYLITMVVRRYNN